MYDNINTSSPGPLGAQIRRLRLSRGLSLAALARRAGTSAPALHRYESGWDRFEVATLRKIASALEARLDIRLTVEEGDPPEGVPKPASLVKLLSPLFWDKLLTPSDLSVFPEWVVRRVLMYGDLRQARAARAFFGSDMLKKALAMRAVDPRTRNFWTILRREDGLLREDGSSKEDGNAPQGTQR